jgi:hypothetical protein
MRDEAAGLSQNETPTALMRVCDAIQDACVVI